MKAWQRASACAVLASVRVSLCKGPGRRGVDGQPQEIRGSFPNYDDPITAEPPLPHPSGALCATLEIMVGVSIDSWGPAVSRPYSPPSGGCKGPWEQVVMQLSGTIAGVQFDRYGAVWLRGVELLRLTGPEPSPAGISWEVTKDVTEYAEVFQSSGEVALLLPNVVTERYTGIFHINISFAFYGPQHPRTPRTIMPLRNSTSFDYVSGAGQANQVKLPRDVTEARLDVYASGHACEEFWYSNSLPADGNCAGGAFRELDVFVDGHLAGAQYPFPVMYTGGANPILWRPLTGILSLNIPAYHFDLTPFLGWLTDGQEHNITLAAVHNWHGNWILNGVLVLKRDSAAVQWGSVEPHEEPLHVWEELRKESDDLLVQTMNGSHGFHVRGSLTLASGEVQHSETRGLLTAWSSNSYWGDDVGVTEGCWHSSVSSARDGIWKTTVAEYPFFLNDSYFRDATSVHMKTAVDFARNLQVSFGSGPLTTGAQPEYILTLQNAETSAAIYNRSFNEKRGALQAHSAESFQVWAADGAATRDAQSLCYSRFLKAEEGSIGSDRIAQNDCEWPRGIYVCGSDLCGHFEEESGGSRFASAAGRGERKEQRLPGRPEGQEVLLPLRNRLGLTAKQLTSLAEDPLLAAASATEEAVKDAKVSAALRLSSAGSVATEGSPPWRTQAAHATASTATVAEAVLLSAVLVVALLSAAKRPCHLAAAGAVPLLEEGVE